MTPWRASLDQVLGDPPDPHEFHARCEACGGCVDCLGCECAPVMEDAMSHKAFDDETRRMERETDEAPQGSPSRILITDAVDDERWTMECQSEKGWFHPNLRLSLAAAAAQARYHAVATGHVVELRDTR